MPDLLVRLYDLPVLASEARVREAGIVIRRPIGPERQVLINWIGERFSDYWISEASVAMSQQPATVYIAVRNAELLGFACYDTTAKGFFGPTGVDEAARGQGIGEALLIATLRGMREAGYGYGIIGDPGPVDFYKRHIDMTEIPKSTPGVYAGMLPNKPKS